MCAQVQLKGVDETLPLDEKEGSAAWRQQKEQLQRNEFFRDCLAPILAEYKVRQYSSCHSCSMHQKTVGRVHVCLLGPSHASLVCHTIGDKVIACYSHWGISVQLMRTHTHAPKSVESCPMDRAGLVFACLFSRSYHWLSGPFGS